MHPSVENALEEIDAAIFTGDSFIQKENRMKLREYLERWERWDKTSIYYTDDGMMCNADGTRSIFDDVDQ